MSQTSRAIVIAGAALLSVLLIAALALLVSRALRDADQPRLLPIETAVAYLYPASDSPQNIWLAVPGNPESARQLTFSPTGIYDFSVSPDGRRIAFSEYASAGRFTDLKLLDLETGGLTQLTNCPDAACRRPVWHPNGDSLAYERLELGAAAAGHAGGSVIRVWLVDLLAVPATTRPLLADMTVLGHSPQWSADGERIAFYSGSAVAIVIYHTATGERIDVASSNGSSGALSPSGAQLVYPETAVFEGSGATTFLRLADLTTGGVRNLSEPGNGTDDSRAVWRPDGTALAVARRDVTRVPGYQVYLLDPETGEAQPLTHEPRYSNMYFWWNEEGTALVIQRFPELDEQMQQNLDGLPEIWTLDAATGTLTHVADNAMLPRWVSPS